MRTMRASTPAAAAALALTVTLGLSACSLFGDDGAESSGAGGSSITIQTTNFPILDPQVVTYGMWLAQQGLLEGLVLQNNEGTGVVPGMAERWETSADGLTYAFHIRQDATWSNGDPVTAADFVWSYRRLLEPGEGAGVTLGANSYQAALGIAGADDFHAGLLTDFGKVGIKATGERELTFTLAAPNPGFLMGLTHPSMLPLHPDTVEKYPEDWQQPEHWVGNGPFVLSAWTPNSELTMKRNDRYWDKENVHLDTVRVRLIEGDMPTVGYENAEVDITPLGSEDVIRFNADPSLSDAVRQTSANTVGYLALLRSENEALADPRVREALSLGLDRETITKNVVGAEPGPSLAPGALPGWDSSLATPTDIPRARQLLAEAGYPDGKGLPEIKILSGSAGSSTPLLDAIVDKWQTDLGIEVKADVVEVGVYVEKRSQVHPADYAGFYIGQFSGQVTWPYYAATLWGPQYIAEFSLPPDIWARYQQITNDTSIEAADKTAQLAELRDKHASDGAKRYGELIEQASAAESEDEQIELYKEAAKARRDTYLILPVYWQSTLYAVRPSLEGVHLRPSFDGFYLKGIRVAG